MIDRPRAVSLSRPWSELVIAGVKPIENRTWRTNHRGLLVIHAARSLDLAGALDTAITVGDRAALELLALDQAYAGAAAPTGYIGVVDLIDVCSASRFADTLACDCGPWAFPRSHHWRLARARRFTEPIAGRGMPGIWRVINPYVDAAIALSTPLPT